MLDIKFVRENPDKVKENIKKKFQDHKIDLVDEVIEKEKEMRAMKQRIDDLRAQRNSLSKQIGGLMKNGQKEEAEKVKQQVSSMADELKETEEKEAALREETSNSRNSVNRSFLISKFRIIQTSWSVLTELISTVHVK